MPIVSKVVCPVCGCCCDDIELIIENNRILEARNACAMGAAKFENYHIHRNTEAYIRRNGKLTKTKVEEAIRKSAEILAEASYPLLYGWSSTSCEAIKVGLELTEEVGGVIDNTSTVCHGPSILAVQDVGLIGATLGQIRHRADLIIYWGSNPWSAHPRHMERYTALSDGRFQRNIWRRVTARVRADSVRKKIARIVSAFFRWGERRIPTGFERRLEVLPPEERKLIVVDVRRTRSAELADQFIQVKPGGDYEVLQALRALIRDETLDVDEVAGIPVETLEEMADVMINCRFGVIFFGVGLTMSRGRLRNVEAAIKLTRDLNERTKFIIIPMRGHFNVTGANTVFTWQTGYPYAVDLSLGYPRYNPGETSAVDILRRGDADAALVIASDPVSNFPVEAVRHLIDIPLIVIDPHLSPTAMVADVVIPSAFVGIEAEGTAYRMDHVPLPLKKVVEPPEGILSDEEILKRILSEVRRLKSP
ncbi:MAG: tungsten-containing formylmethanofuran dehydrogenase 2 subunit B [Candidatus Bathyarchaeota archaeon B63]|nr:MAG: tungsten-containing formylmethanofuran dehydrogenase 2 subunit B [Candidatus Bathyarchaeota archaeon B63]